MFDQTCTEARCRSLAHPLAMDMFPASLDLPIRKGFEESKPRVHRRIPFCPISLRVRNCWQRRCRAMRLTDLQKARPLGTWSSCGCWLSSLLISWGNASICCRMLCRKEKTQAGHRCSGAMLLSCTFAYKSFSWMSGRQHLLYSIYVYILLLYLHVHAGFLNTQAIFALVIPNASDLPVIGLYLKIKGSVCKRYTFEPSTFAFIANVRKHLETCWNSCGSLRE